MPSELICEVVQIGKFGKHPNADTLSITHVYDFPVIFKTGDFKEGDSAIYFPVDAMLPVRPEFAFIWQDKENPTERQRSIKAKKLRGIFSMGLFMPTKLFGLDHCEFGVNVAEILGVVKTPDPVEGCNMSGNNRGSPNWFSHYTDIESARKYSSVFVVGEEVIVTEKIHGANARFAFCKTDEFPEGDLWVGSHRLAKANDDNNEWSRFARENNLKDKLSAYPDYLFFGEIYGKTQAGNGYDYGNPRASKVAFFDIFDIKTGRYLDYDTAFIIFTNLGLETAPVLYRGPWTSFENMESMADGLTILGKGSHNREGFVLRPITERWDERLGRTIIKLHGQAFLLNDKAQKV